MLNKKPWLISIERSLNPNDALQATSGIPGGPSQLISGVSRR